MVVGVRTKRTKQDVSDKHEDGELKPELKREHWKPPMGQG